MILLKVLLILFSVLSLVSMSIYIYLAHKGGSIVLYSTADSRLPTFPQKVFLISAAIGLLVCIYSGVNALLFWIPETLGYVDAESGIFIHLNDTASAIITFVSGFTLIGFLDKSTQNAFRLKLLSIEENALEEILEASTNQEKMQSLKENYEHNLTRLKTYDLGMSQDCEPLSWEAKQIMSYKYCLHMVNQQLRRHEDLLNQIANPKQVD